MPFEKVEIGNCVLLCGDAFEIMESCLESASAGFICTDPPYGVSELSWDHKVNIPSLLTQFKRIRKSSCPTAIFAAGQFLFDLAENINRDRDFGNFYPLIWFKKSEGADRPAVTGWLNANRRPLRAMEHILVTNPKGSKGGVKPTFNPQMIFSSQYHKRGGNRKCDHYGRFRKVESQSNQRYPVDVLEFQIDSRRCNSSVKSYENIYHPSSKPVPLLEYLVKTYSNENELVFDPFMGGGSCALACMNTNRRFVGIERERKYFDMCCRRIEEAYLAPKECSLFPEDEQYASEQTGDDLFFDYDVPMLLEI